MMAYDGSEIYAESELFSGRWRAKSEICSENRQDRRGIGLATKEPYARKIIS